MTSHDLVSRLRQYQQETAAKTLIEEAISEIARLRRELTSLGDIVSSAVSRADHDVVLITADMQAH